MKIQKHVKLCLSLSIKLFHFFLKLKYYYKNNYKKAIEEQAATLMLIAESNGLDSLEMINGYYRIGYLHSKLESQSDHNPDQLLASIRCYSKFINNTFRWLLEIARKNSLSEYNCNEQEELIEFKQLNKNMLTLYDHYNSLENDQSIELLKILFCSFSSFVILRENEKAMTAHHKLANHLASLPDFPLAQEIKSLNL